MKLADKMYRTYPFITATSKDGKLTRTKIEFPWFAVWLTRRWRSDWGYEGYPIPRRFGFAYLDYDRDCMLYVMWPFNFIVAICRRVYFATRWEIPFAFKEYERKWRAKHE